MDTELIAKFMGFQILNAKYETRVFHSSNESSFEWEEGEIVCDENGKEVCDYNQEPYYSLESLPFDEDWNWLMSVVEKIDSLGKWAFAIDSHPYPVSDTCVLIHDAHERGIYNCIVEEIHENKMTAVYNACVKFIKLYNKQSK